MPRQRRGAAAPARSAPARPVAAPQRTNVGPPQTRPASTMATVPQRQAPGQLQTQQPKQQQSPGLFGQMASTAAGVAVGSSIGHAIGGFFGGGSGASTAVQDDAGQTNTAAAFPQDGAYNSSTNNTYGARSCEVDAKQFTQCLDEHQGNMQICGWYLEQLKACQAAASQY